MSTKKQKQKITGDYKTENKFNEFVGGKGHINFIANEATIEGKYLSGLHFNDLVFKLKIYDDGTVDFNEVDTKITTFDERKRLLQVIEDQSLTNYRNRTIVNELVFTSVEKVKDKFVQLYLAVDYVKPINKLASIFDDDLTITDDAMDNLNNLLNSWLDDEDFVEEIEYTTEDPSGLDNLETTQRMNDYMSSLEDSFTKMKEEKLNELKSKKDKIEKEINKLEFQLSTTQKSLEENKNELNLIESRLDELQPIAQTNGYYFNVSERQNEIVVLEPAISNLIRDKVSKIKSINVENFMKLFTNGEYKITISKITDTGFDVVEDVNTLPNDVQEQLSNLDLYFVDGKLTYNGEMSWGELVNKMVRMGFQQNPEFDKFCGSNSYSSKEETKSDIKQTKTNF